MPTDTTFVNPTRHHFEIEGRGSYTLTRGFVDLGGGKVSKQQHYELTRTSSLHGSTREDMAALLAMKFDLGKQEVEGLLRAVDAGHEETEARIQRRDVGAPRIAGGGLPIRRPQSDRWGNPLPATQPTT